MDSYDILSILLERYERSNRLDYSDYTSMGFTQYRAPETVTPTERDEKGGVQVYP